MSDISFRCPACSGVLIVDEAGIGWEVDCPMCGQAVTIPEKSDSSLVEPPVIEPPTQSQRDPAPAEAQPSAPEEPDTTTPKMAASSPVTIPKAQGPAYDRKSLRPALPEAKRPDGVEEAEWDHAKQYICGFAELVFKRTLDGEESDQVAAVTFTSSLGAKLAKIDLQQAAYKENNTTNRRLSRVLILCKINPAPEVLG